MSSSVIIKTEHGEHNYSGPENWDDIMSSRQLSKLFTISRIALEAPFARLMAVRLVYGMPARVLKNLFANAGRLSENLELSVSDKNLLLGKALLDNINWIWSEMPRKRWFLPEIRIWGRKFVSCGDRFDGMTFGQFMFTDHYFEACADESVDYKHNLNMLMAALYRPSSEKSFNKEQIEANARWMRWVAAGKKELILFNYTGLRLHLTNRFPEIFKTRKSTDSTPTDKGSDGWFEVALSLAGKDVQMFYDYEQADMYLVLKILKNAIMDAKKAEELMEKAKRKKR